MNCLKAAGNERFTYCRTNKSANELDNEQCELPFNNIFGDTEKMTIKDNNIFISHRSEDKIFADLLVDFLILIGVPNERIFCSSLPGNDVKSKIDSEIKTQLNNSVLNILILSKDYYESVYCLNEQGIIWYVDKPMILFALPEIEPDKMFGFIDKNYKLNRFDSTSDLSSVVDQLKEIFTLNLSIAKLNDGINKLIARYGEKVASRGDKQPYHSKDINKFMQDMKFTDDETAVLYYIWMQQKRKITAEQIAEWLIQKEIYGIDVQNAFDLLAQSCYGIINEDTFELDIQVFREYCNKTREELQPIIDRVTEHSYSSAKTIQDLWNNGDLDDFDKLFISYIIDEKVISFKDRWDMSQQVKAIQKWEYENIMKNSLSSNYADCLQFFIENKLVFPSEYTSYDEPYEYSLHETIKSFFFSKTFPFAKELDEVKNKYMLF